MNFSIQIRFIIIALFLLSCTKENDKNVELTKGKRIKHIEYSKGAINNKQKAEFFYNSIFNLEVIYLYVYNGVWDTSGKIIFDYQANKIIAEVFPYVNSEFIGVTGRNIFYLDDFKRVISHEVWLKDASHWWLNSLENFSYQNQKIYNYIAFKGKNMLVNETYYYVNDLFDSVYCVAYTNNNFINDSLFLHCSLYYNNEKLTEYNYYGFSQDMSAQIINVKIRSAEITYENGLITLDCYSAFSSSHNGIYKIFFDSDDNITKYTYNYFGYNEFVYFYEDMPGNEQFLALKLPYFQPIITFPFVNYPYLWW